MRRKEGREKKDGERKAKKGDCLEEMFCAIHD